MEKDGTKVHESTVDVEATTTTDDGENVFGAKFIECTWDADVSGDFVVTARLKQTDETVRIGDDAHLDGGCHWISVRVDSSFYALWNDCGPYDDGDNLCVQSNM